VSRDKRPSRLRSARGRQSGRVENNGKTTGKMPGGVTGKGFRPGASGNPGGRPKQQPGTEALRVLLADEKTAMALARAMIKRALKGNVRAFKEIMDRVEGKVANRVEITGANGEELKAKVDAKLSIGDLIGALRHIYGLNYPDSTGRTPIQ
jgi:Family of unknown function (DUF5681)